MSAHDSDTATSSSTLCDVSAIGFLVLDTYCRPAEAMPPAGGATIVQEMRMAPSGTAGGTAMICGLLGLRTQLVTRVGADNAGDWLVHKLSQHCNVQTHLITRNTKGVQTACSMLPIRSTGERAAFFCPGTAATFCLSSPQAVQDALKARIIHVGGTGLLPQFDGPPCLALLRQAKALGRTTILDLILANAETQQLVEPLLPFVDYFCPSIEEAAALAGRDANCRDAPGISQFFKDCGVQNVILTMDKDGVYVLPHDGQAFTLPAHDIELVDSTGCGDSFTAGVIVGLTKGWSLRDTVAFANGVAAQVASGLGSDGGGDKIKSIQDTWAFIKATPLRTTKAT